MRNPFRRTTRPPGVKGRRTGIFARPRTEPIRAPRQRRRLGVPGVPSWMRPALSWRSILWVAPVLALWGLSVAVYNLPTFNVATVTVQGVGSDVAASVQQASGLEGQNLFQADLEGAVERIEASSIVRVTGVERKAPDTVILTVAQRQPRATWQWGERRYLVDVDGVVLGSAEGNGVGVTVRQMDNPVRELAVGQRVSADAIYLAERLTARTAEAVGANPTAFEWQTDGGLLMRTDKGWNVRLGTADDLDYKLVVWRAILDRAGMEQFSATHADVRFPTRPFVRAR